MIVNDCHIERIAVGEPEADSPLLVDADAPLALAVALERLQPVGWRKSQIVYARCRMKLRQTHDRAIADFGRQAPGSATRKKSFSLGICKGLDHSDHHKHYVYNGQSTLGG